MKSIDLKIKDDDIERLKTNSVKASRFLKALANEQRLIILCHLARGEFSVSALQDNLELSQSALSQHLARLRKDNLVHTRRDAQTIYYSLQDGLGAKIIHLFHQHYCYKED